MKHAMSGLDFAQEEKLSKGLALGFSIVSNLRIDVNSVKILEVWTFSSIKFSA